MRGRSPETCATSGRAADDRGYNVGMNVRSRASLLRAPATAGIVHLVIVVAALAAPAAPARAAPVQTTAMRTKIATPTTVAMAVAPAAAAPAAGSTAGDPTAGLLADRVVVHKAAHMLYLYHGDEIIGAYHVELGLDPAGAKERADDFRTPEGHYVLAARNPHSAYFLSIEVSYPNQRDDARAERHHWEPGGDIMIHGTPNDPRYPAAYYETQNWTNGCIALSDSNMVDVWMKTRPGIPIDIYP